ncbi:Transposase, L1 containing protein [Cricetulus griseus]|nr:Transposase, L1 containing protein [Cricetulus griseus]
MEERFSVVEDSIEDIQSSTKENVKSNKSLTQNIQEIWYTVKRPNLRITGIEGQEIQLKGPPSVEDIISLTDKSFQENKFKLMYNSTHTYVLSPKPEPPEDRECGFLVFIYPGNSHNISKEPKVHNDNFYGLGRRLVIHWKVLSSPTAWEPELYLTLQNIHVSFASEILVPHSPKGPTCESIQLVDFLRRRKIPMLLCHLAYDWKLLGYESKELGGTSSKSLPDLPDIQVYFYPCSGGEPSSQRPLMSLALCQKLEFGFHTPLVTKFGLIFSNATSDIYLPDPPFKTTSLTSYATYIKQQCDPGYMG